MVFYSASNALDELDRQLLKALQADGRIKNAELARQVNLSPPAVHARIKRLEQEGYIQRYAALLDREKLGYNLLCFIHVALQMHSREEVYRFQEMMQALPEVQECYHLTGEFDYLLKGIFRNRQELEHFLLDRIGLMPGIGRVHTSLVFSEVKSSTVVPLDREEEDKDAVHR